MKLFPHWLGSLKSSPMADGQPWISYSAIKFLDKYIQKKMVVFEWGVGGSSLYFSNRVERLISVEHESEWAEKVKLSMAGEPQIPWQLHVIAPEPQNVAAELPAADPASFASSVEPFTNLSFNRYARCIDQYADALFDLVVVDGRSRVSCASSGMAKVKPGGYLLLDDADRDRYAWVHEKMKQEQWERLVFGGPTPYVLPFRQTVIWRRPLIAPVERPRQGVAN